MVNKQRKQFGGRGGGGGRGPKGQRQFQSSAMKKQRRKERSERAPVSRFKKNLRHMERSKDAMEALKRQQDAERKYKTKMNGPVEEDEVSMSDGDEDEEREDDFEMLVKTLNSGRKGGGKREEAIESDESESESDEEEEEEDDEDVAEEQEMELGSDMGEEDEDDDEKIVEGEESEKEESVAESGNESEEENTEGDPYLAHISHGISPQMLESLSAKPAVTQKCTVKFSKLGQLMVEIPKDRRKDSKQSVLLADEDTFASEGTVPKALNPEKLDVAKLHLKEKIQRRLEEPIFNELQAECFSVLNNYQDLYYPARTLDNGEHLRFVYCLHALNHILKSTTKILNHNLKLAEASSAKKHKKKVKKAVSSLQEYRDQGLVRPKVLIVVPFRSSALKIVETMAKMFTDNDAKAVTNYKRFQAEYGGDTLYFPRHNPKPEDYERTFGGNTDDNFRIGISFSKSSMKLYTKYYSSDLILASPLGLRMTIGAEGEAERDYDFLSSIEMLILDQAEICMAQNWDHVVHLMDHLHLQPQSTEHTDFSRVRYWCLNGWSRFYRQTLLLSSHDLPEFRSIFNNKCANYRGKIRSANPVKNGSIRHVVVQVPQTFHRIEVSSLEQSFDAKFHHFTTVLLPQLRSITMSRCLIFVPSYFDYVRMRNYFKKEELSFVQICEYSKDAKIARARDMFFHGSSHFLLYSERSHFFRRPRVKGIRHLVFYQLPAYPQFYGEMINLMAAEYQNRKDGIDASAMTVTVLYTKYDLLRLSAVVGSEQAAKIAGSNKAAHTFTTQK